jgi:Putative phage serine protease XkdF
MRITVEDTSGRRVVIDGDDLEKGIAPAEQWDGKSVAGTLIKAEEERRYTLVVAYPASKPDANIAADGFRDFAGHDAVEKAAWSYMLKSRQVGLWHQDDTEGAGNVVESYVYRGPNWTIKSGDAEYTVQAGDWLMGIQWSEDTWPLVKSGRIGGVSMQGSAIRRRPTAEALAALRS